MAGIDPVSLRRETVVRLARDLRDERTEPRDRAFVAGVLDKLLPAIPADADLASLSPLDLVARTERALRAGCDHIDAALEAAKRLNAVGCLGLSFPTAGKDASRTRTKGEGESEAKGGGDRDAQGPEAPKN